VLVAVFGATAEHFLSVATFRTVANQLPDLLLVSIGMTFVILTGGIDLSVGSIVALSGAVAGIAIADWQLPLPAALLLAAGTGVACGLGNGVLVARWPLPSFIVTLGMLEIARGATYLVTGSQTKYIGGSIERLAAPIAWGLTVPVLAAAAIVVVGQLALERSVFGRHMIAVGSSETAAFLCGIDPRIVRLAAFTISGLMAGLAAISQTARLAAADPNAGMGLELQAIAAVVIGGTSLMGGRGSVVATMLGVVIIAVLGAGLAQLGVQEPTRRLITGGVIVAAALVDYYRTRVA
jgi:ribose transport system permease protein